MTDFTLDSLVSEAGDDTFSTERGKAFKDETVYPVQISDVKVIVNKKGRYSAVFKMDRLNHDGSTSKGDDVIVGLPIVTEEALHAEDPEDIQKYKNATGNGFMNVLRALFPEVFSAYASSTKVGTKTKYFAEDGSELTYKQVEARKKLIATPVVGMAKKLIKGEKPMVGVKTYFAWTPNKKNPAYPYANFWSEVPNKYPLAEV